ncbi:MAG: hypothetical protein SNH63_04410 [Rikenellaceae bacterium]
MGGLLFWVVAIWGIILLAGGVRNRVAATQVESVEVDVVDSSRRDNLISSQMVLDMISSQKLVGRKVGEIDYTGLESTIAGNGFVDEVKVYCGYRGDLHVEVSQRQAVARLLVDGYNSYITRDGFIFAAPRTTALYAQVVTGDYPLLVPRGYVGSVDDYMLERLSQIDEQIEQIEREKYALIKQEQANYAELGKLKYTSQRMFESREDYVKRFTDLKRFNQRKREVFAYQQRQVKLGFEAIARRVEAKREEQRRVIRKCDDIHNLLTLLEVLESDRFWRNEVVQLVVSEGDRGEMRVSMSVRSGGFSVTLGELLAEYSAHSRNSLSTMMAIGEQHDRLIEGDRLSQRSDYRIVDHYRSMQRRLVSRSIESKLDRVRYFYDEALARMGWGLYRDINVEFESQVVCRKR